MTVWVTQEPTRRVQNQVVSLFEREAAERYGPVKMLVGANAKIEDPSVQRELWENCAKIDPEKDRIILAGNTALIFAVGYVISALFPGKLELLIYRSREIINDVVYERPHYRPLTLDIEATKPQELVVE